MKYMKTTKILQIKTYGKKGTCCILIMQVTRLTHEDLAFL